MFRSDTDIILTLGRTALNGPSGVKNVQAIQKGYKLTPPWSFERTTPPVPVPKVNFPKWDEARANSIEFISYLNFLLQFTQPPAPSEVGLMARFARIGIAPGVPFEPGKLSPELTVAIKQGLADGKAALVGAEKHTTSSFNIFGSREDLHDDYTTRAVAAAMGIYGNTKEEAVYVGTRLNGDHEPLVGSLPYVIHSDKKDLPPAKFFWSMTMYSCRTGTWWRTQSNGIPWATGQKVSPTARMDRSMSTCSTPHPARSMRRTGCPHPKGPMT